MNFHGNVGSDPGGDVPFIIADDRRRWNGDAITIPNRVSFRGISNTINGGFEMFWDFGRQKIRSVFPRYEPDGTRKPDYELGDRTYFDPPISITYQEHTAHGAWRAIGDRFFLGDNIVWWKGSTQFANLKQFISGGPWEAALDQAKAGGGNIINTCCMKENNRGWEFRPSDLTPDLLRKYGEALRKKKMKAELKVFIDTRTMMPTVEERSKFWHQLIVPVTQEYFDVFTVEGINEVGHGTQNVEAHEITPIPGVLVARGSGGTDAPPAMPHINLATYHGRRIARDNDGRPISNYSHFAWIEQMIVEVPHINEETNKPPDFGYNTDIYHRMGIHARAGAGGTFHWDGGILGLTMDPPTFSCYESFCRGVDGK